MSTTQRLINGEPVQHRTPWGRHIVTGVVLLALLGMLVSAISNPRFRWDIIAEYIVHPTVLAGVGVTVLLTVIVMVISIVLGVLVALMRMSRVRVLSWSAGAYITVFRSIPMLALILLFYNIAALYPQLSIGVPTLEPVWSVSTNEIVSPWVAAVVALVLHETAYCAETVRAGIISISPGQREASLALGLNGRQSFLKVVLPQAMRVIIPPMGNLAIALMKATSLVSVIAVSDLLHSVQLIYANNYQTIPLLIVAIAWYFVLTTVLSLAQDRLEKRLAHSPRVQVKRSPVLTNQESA